MELANDRDTQNEMPFEAVDFSKIKVGVKTLDDAIVDLGDLKKIDKRLAMRLELNNVKYCGIMLIHSSTDIGFLMISYLDKPTINDTKIFAELSYYAQEIGTYLDYAKQVENKNKKWFR